MRSVTYLGVVLAALVVAAACTSDASSPFSPSSFSDAGATIVGTVNVAGSGQSASFQSSSSFTTTTLAEHGSSGLTVQVVGTDITAEADDDGKFTLSGVPSGTIQLHFTGPGLDAFVTLTGVEPDQTIVIVVAVSGSSASVTSDARRSGYPKVSLCHVTGNGSYHLLEVDGNAESAHLGHGDGKPGDEVPDEFPLVFDDECGIPRPGVDIEKATNGEDADAAPGPTIVLAESEVPGPEDVEWTFVVTNTGDFPLVNVIVKDDQLGLVMCPKDSLDLLESMTCTVLGFAVEGHYENLGEVTADFTTDLGMGSVSDSDLSHYLGVLEEPEEPEPGEKVELCHLTANGRYILIEVAPAAVPAHMRHGDMLPPCPVS